MGMRIYLAKLPFQFQHDGKRGSIVERINAKKPRPLRRGQVSNCGYNKSPQFNKSLRESEFMQPPQSLGSDLNQRKVKYQT
jgi:hypothetical protein